MAYKYLSISREDAVSIITINRPPANAIDLDLVNEISDLAGLISEDEAIRAAVLASANEKIFLAESLSFAKELASGPTQAFGMIKDCVNRALDADLASGLAIERENFKKLLESEDAKEGIGAFTQKRKPEFKGK